MSNVPTTQKRYYPKLSSAIDPEDIPDMLGFIKDGVLNLLDTIHFKDLQYSKSAKGDAAFYSLSLVSPKKIGIEIPGTGIYLVLNPDHEDGNISSFPITVQYQWKILAYLRAFSLGNFSFDPQEIFEVALRVLNLTEEQAIAQFVNNFAKPVDDSVTQLQQFVKDINDVNPGWNLPVPTTETSVTEVVSSIYKKAGKYASLVAFSTYLLSADLDETKEKVKTFFRSLIPTDIEAYVKDILIPKFRATLTLSAGIEFPRNILKPLYPEDSTDNFPDLGEIPEPEKFTLLFGEALFYADTEKGFGYNMDIELQASSPAMIGNTGLIIDINKVKVDLSKEENILEADLDGRPKEFMGVYMERSNIYLPSKWFKQEHEQTLAVTAEHLLVGTGGVSGTIALRAAAAQNNDKQVTDYFREYFDLQYPLTVTSNGQDEAIGGYESLLLHINSLPNKYNLKFKYPLTATLKNGVSQSFDNETAYFNFLNSIDPDKFLWFTLSESDQKAWRLGFKNFDITFDKGHVVSSHLAARLEIEKFQKAGSSENMVIDLNGEWENQDNFKLTAGLASVPPMTLFNNIILTLQTAELGKSDGKFFIGADTKISFPEDGFIGKIFKGKEIDLPALRIYSNGKFEIAGGIAFIPLNITLPIGPVEMSVSGIHLGSVQRLHEGQMRSYNYVGFDGGLSIDPVGVDIKGNGIKYYYTTDDSDFGGVGDRFLHISTIKVDLVIPGTASEEQAIAIIKGSLTIPEPGVSSEYAGSISLKIPKAKIAGEASMRLNPKNKSFLIEAALESPNALIPLGPVGIYGFKGLVGKKYVADKKAVFHNDAESKTWYDYFMAPERGVNVEKFREPAETNDYTNPFSVGIGASLATTADGGRTASLRAMFLLSIPSMFAIDAGLAILTERLGLIDSRTPPFYAFIIIGDHSLEFGAGANYKLSQSSGAFIEIQGEMQAGFFFKNQRPWYVNFGTREKPITATLFKGILNIKAESFLMISGSGIEAGAKVGIDFDLFIARAWVLVEVGASISFERPQIGGYMYIEGGFSLNFFIIKVSLSVSMFFSVELIKPFLIFAQLKVKFEFKIKLFIVKIKIKFDVTLTFKWEKEKNIDRTAIAPLTYNPVTELDNPDYPKDPRVEEYVKGIHMLTNEAFNLKYLGVKENNDNFNFDPGSIDAVIPLDTFIDIKMEKGLAPSAFVDTIIGGHTNMAEKFIDLIPPVETVKGGRTVRQVKHKYSIESIDVKCRVGDNWVSYNPYEALLPASSNENVSSLRLGQWQKNSEQYDTIRLLATTPFTFMDQGEPGWFVPEQYGINASTLFCSSHETKENTSNFLNIPLGSEYYSPTGYIADLICGAYYNIDGTYTQVIDIDEDGNVNQTISPDKMVIRNTPNAFNYARSLEFSNYDKLTITLPDSSASVKLKLATYAAGLTLEVYHKNVSDTPKPVYEHLGDVYLNKEDLKNEISLKMENFDNKTISQIKIVPNSNNRDDIDAANQEIAQIWAEAGVDLSGQISLTLAQQARIDYLESLLNALKQAACSDIVCKNLVYDVLNNDFNGQNEDNFSIVINDSKQLEEIAEYISNFLVVEDVDFSNHSVIVIYNDFSDLIVPEVVNVVKSKDSIKVQLKDIGMRPGFGKPYLIIKTEKLKDLPVIITYDDAGCSEIPCDRQDVLCDYFDQLKVTLTNCVNPNKSFVENISCFNNFFVLIDQFDKQYPEYVIGDKYELPLEWEYNYAKPPTVQEALNQAFGIIEMIKNLSGNCGCNGSEGDPIESLCITAVQEVRWQTLTDYEYESTIPGQPALDANSYATVAAINKTLQPIWRPDTTYMLHFRLRDEVDNGVGNYSKNFDYYYGFKTVGPVGHFHNQYEDYLLQKLKDQTGETVLDESKKAGFEEQFPITSLRSYIDYRRSYPNADGNLLMSKPLYYGNEQCKINLYFDKTYVYHMLTGWKDYKGLPEIKGDMHVAIKDPISDVIIPYPLPEEWSEEDVPMPEYEWNEDHDPNLPSSIQVLMNYIEELNASQDATKCKLDLGLSISPISHVRTVKLTNLKPEKLYTAIVYNNYYENRSEKIENQIKDGNIAYEENQKVHEFVFRTSRYADFKEQVESYMLKETDQDTQIANTRQAVYELNMDLSTQQIDNLFAIMSGDTDLLQQQYADPFDRALEGVLQLKPLDAPKTTDFVKIKNSNNNSITAILVRNPEPFNDPKMHLEDIKNTLSVVLGSKHEEEKYKVLYSKDYSQMLVMHDTKVIDATDLTFRFVYKTWNGKEYVTEVELKTNPIIINN